MAAGASVIDAASPGVSESRPLQFLQPAPPGALRQETRDEKNCPLPPVGSRLIGH